MIGYCCCCWVDRRRCVVVVVVVVGPKEVRMQWSRRGGKNSGIRPCCSWRNGENYGSDDDDDNNHLYYYVVFE